MKHTSKWSKHTQGLADAPDIPEVDEAELEAPNIEEMWTLKVCATGKQVLKLWIPCPMQADIDAVLDLR